MATFNKAALAQYAQLKNGTLYENRQHLNAEIDRLEQSLVKKNGQYGSDNPEYDNYRLRHLKKALSDIYNENR